MDTLRQWRKRHKVSQAELARRIGVKGSAMAKYELGRLGIKPEIAKRIEAATNGEVTAAKLLGLDRSPRTGSVREEPAKFEQQTEIVAVAVPAAMLRRAQEFSLDIASLLAAGGLEAVRQAIAEACYAANKSAFDAINAELEAQGTFAEQMGVNWA